MFRLGLAVLKTAATCLERAFLPDPGAARALATFKKKRGFVGIGAELYALLRRRFRPVDHVAVVRGSRKLEQPVFHGAAAQ